MTRLMNFLLLTTLAMAITLSLSTNLEAQDVEVYSANPDYALQGDTDIEVQISGAGFEKGATVRFIRFETEEEGLIEVVGEVKVRGSTKLIARINVDSQAIVDDYNIEVTLRSGRRGKGTTRLFAVKPGNGNTDLVAKFCLDFDSGLSLSSDGGSIEGSNGASYQYCEDRAERVSIATGKGPGFNFESYNRSKGGWIRKVWVDFPGGAITATGVDEQGQPVDYATFVSGEYKVVIRFDKDEGGLDLGSLDIGESGQVSIFMGLFLPDGNFARLAHGSVPNPGVSNALYGNECVKGTEDAVVTRTAQHAWTIESYPGAPNVCLWDFEGGLENQPGVVVSFPYRFTLVEQP